MKIQLKLKERNAKLFLAEENKEKSLNDLFPQIPSICYIDLFNTTDSQSYTGNGF
jgi:hypothetical protein